MRRVGVIGGGQLAWMMADAAQVLGIELAVQTPQPTDPAVAIATHTVLADIADADATAELAAHADVITFENEFIDLAALSHLAGRGIQFYPTLNALAPLLDKYDQRSYLTVLGLPTPQFVALTDPADDAQVNRLGFPVVLKSRRLGYDGQGTFICPDRAALDAILNRVSTKPDTWLLEEFVPFERELAVMAARSSSGDVVTYPVVETQQVKQVCQRVIVTPDIAPAVADQVRAITTTLLNSLGFVGIMGIEFFLTPNGRVLINETAPRTHNSGHYSLDACVTSQFEQQLRAVCGLPLGSAALTSGGAVMVNLLGFETATCDYLAQRQALAQIPQAHLYWYGKTAARPGRKLGHVTVRLTDGQGRAEAIAIAEQVEALWYP